ncbi:AI-2E family transporter [Pseudoduganella albidiflava]|uniref:AI-2E family transporter n=1 Tax=Pseudoduganella albidiflava TaxID=321983 RepID=A0A411WXW9_9BURK|nr:AI-2E family transporter [Pseudoduganella albidiflava]QBI01538.1 AI-2E family transporter [Pseudoduganella albidiflava]GGY34937.1 AI-2E family transporter [Pseudoduganella albidiflava]
MERHEEPDTGKPAEHRFTRRVALVNGITLMAVLVLAAIWFAYDALLLVFACILFAILLYELAGIVHRRLHLGRNAALALVVLALLLIFGIGGWLMAPQIGEQADRLGAAVPEALQRFRAAMEQHPLLKRLMASVPSPEQMQKQLAQLVPNAGLFFSGLLGAAGNAVIILFVGIYFAAQPHIYLNGLVTLVPPRKRQRAREVLDELGRTLSRWLLGKAASMLLVTILSATGLALLDVPLALILGLIAGLLDFIPYLGPLMAGVPAMLIAFSDSPQQALYVVLLFGAIQLAEGYLLSPLIEKRTVSLPPALTIVMQLLFGALFGMAGVALATPLTAVLAVLVTMLYVQDVLKDPVRTPSERHDD